MQTGPQPMDRTERMRLAQQIARRARDRYGDRIKAIGLYGSIARGTDGPFSDIEMYVVLRTRGEEYSYEWAAGPWKAEVDVYSEEVLLERAAEVEGRWPLTHGSVQAVLPLYDPEGFFAELRRVVTEQPAAKFRAAIEETIYGEVYEVVGKVRNALAAEHSAALPALAVELARLGAFLVGLHHRRCFTTGTRVLEEALALPDRPAGLDELCRLVMHGDLADPERVAGACERLWTGVEEWAARHGYRYVSDRPIPF